MHYSTPDSPTSTAHRSHACPRCGVPHMPTEGPGTLLHYSRLLCSGCGAYLKWRKWPRDPHGRKLPRPACLEPASQCIDTLKQGGRP